MEVTNLEKDGYLFSNDKSLLQIEVIHTYLSTESYWANGIPLEVVEKSISNSECFGVYHTGKQIGFARWITDKATFGYLADVFILPEHRGKRLSKVLMQFMLSFPWLKGCRRLVLATRDAHSLYAQNGFEPLSHPDRFMEIVRKDIYKSN